MRKILLFKKFATAAMAQVLLIFWNPIVPTAAEQPALSEASTVQMNNIVLFAQHAPLSESNFMEDRSENIVSMCNGADTFRSLSGYIDAISYGKLNVTSYFPQMNDGVITPYVLSSAETEYISCEAIAIEILQNIDIPDDIPLDGNSDGIVDNIIFIIDGKANDMNSPIWPRAFSLYGMRLNGLSVNRANIQNSAQIFENQITGAGGVLCHEFLHSLGYPDLYRNERTGTPVGVWDIMASNSVFLQYPLAYQRANISGWLDSEDITESGTYTLSPASADTGNRLYLLKTPLSDTEFFAVEYRQQGKRYSDELDVKIYGTGLVVYRINTEADGNFKGSHDEIYVFRPGETALNAGEGDLFSSNYGGENAPDSVGSLDWNADITDGALVYSNGTNSGIRISDIVMNEESLTFSVDFADTSEVKLWESISSDSLDAYMPYQLASSSDGTVYLIAADDGYAVLYRINGSELTTVGQPLGSGRYRDMNQPKLAFCGNTPYVLYHDKDFILHLCRYDLLSGGWTEVYRGTELAQYAALTADKNKLYFTYTTGTFPYALQAVCYAYETETVTMIGENIAANACNMSTSVLNGNPVIAYRDINDGNKAKLAVYHSGEWNVTTVSETACGTVSMVSDGNIVWIAPSGSGNAIYQLSDEKLTAHPLPDSVSENIFVQIPIVADEQCYLAVNTQNPDKLAVYSFNGTDWEMTGDILAMDVVNSLSLAYSENTLYCSCFTSNETAVIKQLHLGTSRRLMGDVNADGEFNIADVVMMQKWLLSVPDTTLANWKAGDLFEDHRLDAIDLCMMKRALIQRMPHSSLESLIGMDYEDAVRQAYISKSEYNYQVAGNLKSAIEDKMGRPLDYSIDRFYLVNHEKLGMNSNTKYLYNTGTKDVYAVNDETNMNCATWYWKGTKAALYGIDDDAEKQDEFLDAMEFYGITEIYYSIGANKLVNSRDIVEAFVKNAYARNMKVYLLTGEKTWLYEDSYQTAIYNIFDKVEAYNSLVGYDAKLAGVSYDVEVWTNSEYNWKNNDAARYQQVKFIETAQKYAASKNLSVSHCLPFWIVQYDYTDDAGITRNVYDSITQIANDTILMVYRDSADAVEKLLTGVQNNAENSVFYYIEKNDCNLEIAVQAAETTEGDYVTFYEEEKENPGYVTAAIATMKSDLEPYQYHTSYAIHHAIALYEYYLSM